MPVLRNGCTVQPLFLAVLATASGTNFVPTVTSSVRQHSEQVNRATVRRHTLRRVGQIKT